MARRVQPKVPVKPMPSSDPTLRQLGWKPFFGDQVTGAEADACRPVRVMSVHRGMVTVLGEGISESISSALPTSGGAENRPAVGDWLLIERDSLSIVRILDRVSLFKRPSPADDRRIQLIAANVDTLFIVTSCDQDFNVARIERYLVLAREVNVRPVIVLTKSDLSPDPHHFVETARALQPELEVALINARDAASVARLADHCGPGETVALVGSSGVGKSTLVNTLTGSDSIATQAVRETDGKGQHTTTVREMHRLGHGSDAGGWLVDTPGMRELQMSEVGAGVAEVFDDIIALTLECRFTNCSHADEPDCAVRAAIEAGTLASVRVDRWHKLTGEDVANTAIAAAVRARPRKTGRRK
jgi:ribosome biogenesis GTPase / thiamine phosphate phosphatase